MSYDKERDFLKEYVRDRVDFTTTDQVKGIEMPPIEREIPEGAELIKLPEATKELEKKTSLLDLVKSRASRRKFTGGKIYLNELSYLLYVTYGVRESKVASRILRTAPSAGNRHSIETTLIVLNVKELDPGIYRYLPLEHALYKVSTPFDLIERLSFALRKQAFAINSAVVFAWSTIPYRTEWRYKEAAHKVIAIDVGHVAENLYLACEALGFGTCAIGAYDQDLMDELIEVDGEEEFTIYVSPVGKY